MIANPTRFDPDPRTRRRRRRGATSRSGGWSPTGASPRRGGRLHRRPRRCPTEINQVQPRDAGLLRRGGEAGLFDDPRLGATREERQNRVFRGGLRIYTTLDPRAQALATTLAQRRAGRDRAGGHAHRRSCRSPRTRDTGEPRQRHRRRRVGRARHRCGARHGRRRRVRERAVQRHHPGRRALRRVDLQDLRAHGPAGERLPPHRQRERRRPVHLPGHPRDVPRPVPGRELRQQRRRGRHDHLADAALVELRLRAPRPDRRHRQGGASRRARWGSPRRSRTVVSMPLGTKEVLPIDMAGGGRVDRRRRHVPPRRTTSTASRVPTAR